MKICLSTALLASSGAFASGVGGNEVLGRLTILETQLNSIRSDLIENPPFVAKKPPVPCSSINLTVQKAGVQCVTSKGAVFTRVFRNGHGTYWQDPQGLLWSDDLGLNSQDYSAQICSQLNGFLPSSDHYVRGLRQGILELFPEIKNQKFWTTDEYWLIMGVFHVFNAADGSAEETESHENSFSTRCLFKRDAVSSMPLYAVSPLQYAAPLPFPFHLPHSVCEDVQFRLLNVEERFNDIEDVLALGKSQKNTEPVNCDNLESNLVKFEVMLVKLKNILKERFPMPTLCSAANPSAQPIGFRCLTSKGKVYTRVSRDGFGEAWRDFDGNIWSDLIGESNQRGGIDACEKLGSNLPTQAEFEEAEDRGIREVLPNLKGRWYWAQSIQSDFSALGFIWRGDYESGYGFADLRRAKNSIRCLFTNNWKHESSRTSHEH